MIRRKEETVRRRWNLSKEEEEYMIRSRMDHRKKRDN